MDAICSKLLQYYWIFSLVIACPPTSLLVLRQTFTCKEVHDLPMLPSSVTVLCYRMSRPVPNCQGWNLECFRRWFNQSLGQNCKRGEEGQSLIAMQLRSGLLTAKLLHEFHWVWLNSLMCCSLLICSWSEGLSGSIRYAIQANIKRVALSEAHS